MEKHERAMQGMHDPMHNRTAYPKACSISQVLSDAMPTAASTNIGAESNNPNLLSADAAASVDVCEQPGEWPKKWEQVFL